MTRGVPDLLVGRAPMSLRILIDGAVFVHAALTALEQAISGRWRRTTPWIESGAYVRARACSMDSGEALCLTAVRCDVDGLATAALAREIAALEFLAHQPAVLPLQGSGRIAGWLFAATPCTAGRALAAEAPLDALEVLEHLIAIADLLHFMHGAGLAHTAISGAALVRYGDTVRLGAFSSAVRLAMVPDRSRCIADDVAALASAGSAMLTGTSRREAWMSHTCSVPGLVDVLLRATSPQVDERYATAIAFAQALCAVRDGVHAAAEVTARDGALDETPPPLSDGVERSLSVLHALLDCAEVDARPPEPSDPLVQRCWARAVAQVAPEDARLVALRVRWLLLADRDPAGALRASLSAQGAAAVWPYRARALAALGRAAEARMLAVRAWYEDVALDGPALRSLTMALVLTRAFDLATLVSVTGSDAAVDDPVVCAAMTPSQTAAAEPLRMMSAIAAAIEARMPWTAELLVDPRWDALRGDPTFTTLVGRARAIWSV